MTQTTPTPTPAVSTKDKESKLTGQGYEKVQSVYNNALNIPGFTAGFAALIRDWIKKFPSK